jgi:hypothetical protein
MPTSLAQERRSLDWWPPFVREMLAHIGAALQVPLDRTRAHDLAGPWPDHRIEIAYVSAEEFAADDMDEPDGRVLVHITGPRYGGARWEFYPDDFDMLVSQARRH